MVGPRRSRGQTATLWSGPRQQLHPAQLLPITSGRLLGVPGNTQKEKNSRKISSPNHAFLAKQTLLL